MQKKMIYRIVWGMSLIMIFSLACGLVDQIVGVKSAAEAVSTSVEQGMELLNTLPAIVTEFEGSGIAETAKSVVTEMPVLSGEKPDDIPVMEGATSLAGSTEVVSYITDAGLQAVVDFYKREMPANGWSEVKVEVKSDTAELKYSKGSREAEITIVQIPFINQTNVTIQIKG